MISKAMSIVGLALGLIVRSSLALGLPADPLVAVVAAIASGSEARPVTPRVHARASAQCRLDCYADQQLSAHDLVRLLNGVMGGIEPDACDQANSNHDSELTVEEAVRAVNEVETVACTSSNVDVTGHWVADNGRLASSTCGSLVDQTFEVALGLSSACSLEITRNGDTLTLVNCNDRQLVGTVDNEGHVEMDASFADPSVGCDFAFDVHLSVDASHSPTEAQYVFQLSFGPDCGIELDCSADLRADWRR